MKKDMEQIIRGKARLRALLSSLLLVYCIAFIGVLSLNGLLSEEGFIKPLDVTGSMDTVERIAGNPLASMSTVVSLTASGKEYFHTGFQLIEDGRVTGECFAVNLGDRYILCMVDPKRIESMQYSESYTFTGSLTNLLKTEYELVIKDMMDAGLGEQQARQALYGQYIDTVSNNAIVNRVLFYVSVLAAFGLFIFLFARNVLVLRNVVKDPAVRRLSRFGDADVLFQDIRQSHSVYSQDKVFHMGAKSHTVTLLPDWIIVEQRTGMRFYPVRGLLWAYSSLRTTKSTVYHLPTKDINYFVMLRYRNEFVCIHGTRAMAERLIDGMSSSYPWVAYGYSPELETLWQTDIHQFAEKVETSSSAYSDPGKMEKVVIQQSSKFDAGKETHVE